MKQLLSVALLSAVAFASFAIGNLPKPQPQRDCTHSHKSCGPLQELRLVGNKCECVCKHNLAMNEKKHCERRLK